MSRQRHTHTLMMESVVSWKWHINMKASGLGIFWPSGERPGIWGYFGPVRDPLSKQWHTRFNDGRSRCCGQSSAPLGAYLCRGSR